MNLKSATIDESDPNFPMINMEINGHRYRFTVKGYPKDHWGWLCGVFTSNIVTAFEQGRNAGIKEAQEPIKKLWDLSLDKRGWVS